MLELTGGTDPSSCLLCSYFNLWGCVHRAILCAVQWTLLTLIELLERVQSHVTSLCYGH